MNKLIDLVMSTIEPGLKYRIEKGVICYNIRITNKIHLLDANTFNPIFKHKSSGEEFVFSPEKLEEDFIKLTNLNVHIIY